MRILYNLINEIEFKLEVLPQSYFVNYFKETFLPQLKDFDRKLNEKCNIQPDSLKEAELLNEIRKIV